MNRAFFTAFLCAGALAAQSTIAKLSPSDIDRGKKLYEGHCSVCHGQTGTGGKGPRLAQPTLPHAPDDDRLAEVIKNGIPGTEMPAAWQMTDKEIWQVAGYVRSMGRTPQVKLPGDASRGQALYAKSGCSGCHIVRGSGTGLGPELSDVGLRRSADYLREALTDPGASVPDGFLVIVAATTDGKTIRGMRINEDSFTLQLRDASGKLYSFRKSSLVSVKKQFHESLMPAYSKLTPAELDDLVAYLASLRGETSEGESRGGTK